MTENSYNFGDILKRIEKIKSGAASNSDKLQKVCDLLAKSIPGYDWVGFYLVDPASENELILGPYTGEPTEHVRIKFGQGICGQAAEKEDTIVVDDVSAEDNYLSCNINVRSEIVVPIYRDGNINGELDLDSHQPARFDTEDKVFLEKVADSVSGLL